MKRREFISLIGGAAAMVPLVARAQQPAKKMLRVGTVSGTQQSSPQWGAFLQRMAELGYQEGKTFAFDFIPTANEEGYETGYRTLMAREPISSWPPAWKSL
jgi:putative ABC transport system substrate-binding protein